MTLEEMRQIKQEKGYTMAQLSEYSKVPLGTLQKIFTGETAHPRYATRQAIERVLRSPNVEASEPCDAAQGYRGTQPDCVMEAAAVYGAKKEKRQGEYTIEDYYAWPEDQRVELIDGVIYIMEAPEFVHQRVASKLLFRIMEYIEKNGGDCIPLLSPVDVRLDCDDKTMVQPDLIILCDKDKIKRWGIMGAPEFLLEVLSRSTRRKDCIKKLQKYADAGVKEYWIIDPEKKMLITYDFVNENIPGIYPLTGKRGLALYGGELEIDLDEIASVIQEWPE